MNTIDFIEIDLLGQKEGNATYKFEGLGHSTGRILAYREKGSLSGNHWHEGKSESKNPEELLLVKGKVRVEWTTDLEGDYIEERLVSAPILIRIHPMVKHRLEALEDICFVEFNSIEEHANDTQYPNDA